MFIYLITNQKGHYKIGVSKNPDKRIKSMETGNPDDLVIFYRYKTKNAHKIERILHRLFESYKVKLEWFELPIYEVRNFIYNCTKIETNLNYLEENKI